MRSLLEAAEAAEVVPVEARVAVEALATPKRC
nr:MAG TPA: hypothetical protein [Caudoviricetes sp.]